MPYKTKTPLKFFMLRREPSQTYLDTVKAGYVRQEKPGRKLVVLDLNGTLCYRPPQEAGRSQYPCVRKGLDAFTEYLFKHFHVMVWSSAQRHNVESMCRALFSVEQEQAMVVIWARDTLRMHPRDFNRKIQTYKNLDWVWNHPYVQHTKVFSQKDTIVLDDSREKLIQHPHNIIALPEYTHELHRSNKDTALEKVQDYLEELRYCSNVSAYIAKNPLDFKAKSRKDDKQKTESATAVPETPVDVPKTDETEKRPDSTINDVAASLSKISFKGSKSGRY